MDDDQFNHILSELKTLKIGIPTSRCPDETVLAEFVEGTLDEISIHDVRRHLADCELCRQAAVIVMGSLKNEDIEKPMENSSRLSEMLDSELNCMEQKLGISDNKSNPIQRPRVMIVDDDLIYLSSLNDILSTDYDIIACQSGNEALSLINEEKVDTVVLDIKMAGMDGLQVAGHLSKDEKSRPIIFNTAYPGEYVRSNIENGYHPFGYVTKDDPDRLLTCIRRATDQAYRAPV